jgi:hypothetical protein
VRAALLLWILACFAQAGDKLDPNDTSLAVLKSNALLASDEATYRKAFSMAVQGENARLKILSEGGLIFVNQNSMLPVHIEGGNGFSRVVSVLIPGYSLLWYTGVDQVDRDKSHVKAAVENRNKDD